MKTFDDYARYYDLLYRDKDYQGESDYIADKIQTYAAHTKTIIDLGCGTGIHAKLLAEKGHEVTGIDISESMVEQAKKRNPDMEFVCANLQNFSLGKKADSILALFHVISYQVSNQALTNALTNIKRHLNDDGLFLFDCWHGPAVMTVKPATRIKRLQEDSLKITRIAEPEQNFENNYVDVNYHVFVNNDSSYSEIKETHRMRYFFKPELELLLGNHDMEIIHSEEWLTKSEPSKDSWGVLYVIKNKKRNV